MELSLEARPKALGVHPSSARRLLCALPVLAAASLLYVFLASVGTFHDIATQKDYYDRMAEGFRAGHLYIQEAPLPALLAQPDPFAGSNVRLWLWDASLYNDHYYMYWGPVPGLLLLGYKLLTATHERITDQWPTTLLMLGRLYAGAALILTFASRVRLRQPAWASTLAVAVFALANPLPFIVARPHVYEAALAGGQCFLFWGICFAFWGLEREKQRRSLFLAASGCFALAVGCRATAFISAPLIIGATLAFSFRRSPRAYRPLALDALSLGVPFSLGVMGYGIYNYARFDSPFEFGVNWQVTGQPFTGNSSYVVPNVFSYLFGPIRLTCRFPIVGIIHSRHLSSLLTWPPGYQNYERAGGVMWTCAWCWFALLGLAQIWVHVRNLQHPRDMARGPALSRDQAWLLLCSVALIASMIPVLSLWEASMRYAGDAVGGLVLAGTVGVFWILQRSHTQRRTAHFWLVRVLVVAAGLQTCVFGALASITTTDDPFKNYNRPMYDKMDQLFSLCNDPPP